MKVQALMTKDVRTCRNTDSLAEAARIMWEGDYGCVPVTDGSGAVVGMITDRDACMASYMRGLPLKNICVSEAMSHELIACGPDDEIGAAERRMAASQVHRMPVIEASGRLVGLLSINDLVRASARDGRSVDAASLVQALAGIGEPRRALAVAVQRA
jgi:CBS domain-containing protein